MCERNSHDCWNRAGATTHFIRRTFAATVLLYNDVPKEIVSKLLGYSSMKITPDSFGKIVEKKRIQSE